MKRRELEQKLMQLGWRLARRGRRHDIWSKGEGEIALPRHKEINDYTAQTILKQAGGDER